MNKRYRGKNKNESETKDPLIQEVLHHPLIIEEYGPKHQTDRNWWYVLGFVFLILPLVWEFGRFGPVWKMFPEPGINGSNLVVGTGAYLSGLQTWGRDQIKVGANTEQGTHTHRKHS